MIYTFEEIKEKATPIAEEYGLFNLILFGSYARGEADEESDIDLVYDGKLTGLMQYSSLVRKLESIFGCHVNLVSTNIRVLDINILFCCLVILFLFYCEGVRQLLSFFYN